jgi:hypothetical protein
LSKEASIDFSMGKQIYQVLQQPPEELYTLTQQQLMLETILLGKGQTVVDVANLKTSVKAMNNEIKEDKDFDAAEGDLFKKHSTQIASHEQPLKPAGQVDLPQPPPTADKKEEKAHAKS